SNPTRDDGPSHKLSLSMGSRIPLPFHGLHVVASQLPTTRYLLSTCTNERRCAHQRRSAVHVQFTEERQQDLRGRQHPHSVASVRKGRASDSQNSPNQPVLEATRAPCPRLGWCGGAVCISLSVMRADAHR